MTTVAEPNKELPCKSLQVDSNTWHGDSNNEECLDGFTCYKPVRGKESQKSDRSLYLLVLGEPVWIEMNGGGKLMPAATRAGRLHFALSVLKGSVTPSALISRC
jgi:hypothetical protein